jgi:hypothetical protein
VPDAAMTVAIPVRRETPAIGKPFWLRKVAVILALLIAASGIGLLNADQADAATVGRRWYGYDLMLNRSETNNLMFGSSAAAAAALGIPDPTLTKLVSGALILFTGYANWAYNKGGCMKFRIVLFPRLVVVPNHYYGGSCR